MNRRRIVADDKIPFLKGVMEPYADIQYLPGSKTTAEDVKDADAIFTRTRTKCKQPLLEGSKVKLIATATIGYDHIDTAYCEENGIRWVNAPGCNSSSVQQYIAVAIATLAKERQLDLSEMTLGIIGLGNVGCKVAAAGAFLGLKLLFNDPPRVEKEGAAGFVSLDELLAASDIITCHTPLERGGKYPTFHLADDDFFAKCKPGVIFINSSRGEVTDSEALKRAIGTKVSDYILDVWEGEPLLDPTLLEGAFIATPHIAGYSSDGKANGTAACVREFAALFGVNELRDWYPTEVPPPPMTTKIEIDAKGKTRQEVVSEAIIHTYPILQDSEALKHSPDMFEKLRGDYWIRREFSSFSVKLINGDDLQEKVLTLLGFRVES